MTLSLSFSPLSDLGPLSEGPIPTGLGWRWDPEVERLAALWQVIALKEAVDSMDVGHDTVIFPRAVLDLTDALLGTGAGPLDLSLLRKQSPDAQAWLEISRAVGTEGVTDWSETRAALGQHLRDQAQRASTLVDDPALADLLGRISSRAVP